MCAFLTFFTFSHVPSVIIEGEGLMTYTTSHQEASQAFWLHFIRRVSEWTSEVCEGF